LEVSQIDELPPGRKAIQTTLLTGRDRTHAYDLIRREIVQGRQTYMVLPLVEESEKLDLKSAIDEHQRLQETIFPDFTVGLLHGRMTSAEKDAAITAFRDGHTHILVSTTVVEVGVDVPNASVMLIEHAERFGLSQLHQLRGRVGRGADQSFCLLMSAPAATPPCNGCGYWKNPRTAFLSQKWICAFGGRGRCWAPASRGCRTLPWPVWWRIRRP
jgi:ATP-dependent DNA helicase RecG